MSCNYVGTPSQCIATPILETIVKQDSYFQIKLGVGFKTQAKFTEFMPSELHCFTGINSEHV